MGSIYLESTHLSCLLGLCGLPLCVKVGDSSVEGFVVSHSQAPPVKGPWIARQEKDFCLKPQKAAPGGFWTDGQCFLLRQNFGVGWAVVDYSQECCHVCVIYPSSDSKKRTNGALLSIPEGIRAAPLCVCIPAFRSKHCLPYALL